ncbi:hypothetical protein HELRODRAFT_88673, partial [Helobdella robusta]|uniref:Ubiquinol-cytochrome c chaperone domain-containing protein n=1 Tax=Helobdella robusta TaxID=6412 RepID=T1G753_HELRO
IKKSALRLYLCCIELVSHDTFIREFGLSDTFNSWFRVLELHLWMLMVRLSDEGKDGLALRNSIINYMWQDIDKKTKKLGVSTMTARREGVMDISEQFKAALFSYDEGLLGDDKQLAGALWRNFFDKNCNNAHDLERMVEYVRKQVYHFDWMI